MSVLGDQFWSKVNKLGSIPQYRPNLGHCWLWVGAKNNKDYGQIRVLGKLEYAHRLSYRDKFGLIPIGLEIDHLCRNHACVRPTHLEAVTHKENSRRGVVGGKFKELCSNGHPYDVYGVPWKNGKGRNCRLCMRASSLAYYHRKKLEAQ